MVKTISLSKLSSFNPTISYMFSIVDIDFKKGEARINIKEEYENTFLMYTRITDKAANPKYETQTFDFSEIKKVNSKCIC